MRGIERFIAGVTKGTAFVAAGICFLMLVLIVVEIFLRSVLSTSTYLMDELVGYGVAAMTFLGLAYSLKTDSLIRINILLERLNKTARNVVEVGCATATLLIVGFAASFFWVSLSRHYVRGTSSGTMADVPNWIPEAVVFVGLVAFCLQLAAITIRSFIPQRNPDQG